MLVQSSAIHPRIGSAILGAGLCLCFSAHAFADLVTLTPTQDIAIARDKAYGADDGILRAYNNAMDPNFNVGTFDIRPLIRFDLSGVTDPIIGAVLELTTWKNPNFPNDTYNPQTLTVHRLTTNWDQSSVTWTSPWSAPGGDFDLAMGTFNVVSPMTTPTDL